MRANSQISVRHQDEGKIVIFDITGYLTDASEPILSDAYADAEVQDAEKVLLNFERRSFITSSGFGEIIRLLWKMREKGQVLRVCTSVYASAKYLQYDRIDAKYRCL